MDEGVEPDHALGLLRYLAQARVPGAELPRLERAADRRQLSRIWRRLPESRPLLGQLLARSDLPASHPAGGCGLRVRVLGTLATEVAGRDVTPQQWPRRAAADAVRPLLLLLRNPRPFDEAHEHLWPELDAEAALGRLYRAGHALRRLLSLPSDAVRTSRAGAALNGPDAWVDAWALQERIEQAGLQTGHGAGSAWREAAELHRGRCPLAFTTSSR